MKLSPETFPVIQGHEPAAANAVLDTSDWIKLSNANGVLITVMHYSGGGDTDVTLSVHEGETGSGTTAIAEEFPIWVNTDTATSDAMVRQTDATSYKIDTGDGKDQIVQFYIPASILSAGYKWVQLGATAGNASNIMSVLYQLDGARYQEDGAPTAIA